MNFEKIAALGVTSPTQRVGMVRRYKLTGRPTCGPKIIGLVGAGLITSPSLNRSDNNSEDSDG